MKNLTKLDKPQVLVDNAETWKDDLIADFQENGKVDKNKQNRYNHATVKTQLRAETQDKCAYCESKITHIDYGDIEHIIPKSKVMELTFEWTNLTLACSKCNTNKGDYYDVSSLLLNPYEDTISEHLRAFGGMILHINSSSKGELTYKKLQLNRPELLERRREKIYVLQTMINNYNLQPSSLLQEFIKSEIDEFVEKNEFCFTLHQFLIDSGFDSN